MGKGLHKKENRRSNRYWSLMIVGERGQVIRMQRIKPIIILAAACLVLAILAAVVSTHLYLGASQKVVRLENQLGDLERNMEALKEEKDLLMAKLVIVRQQNRRLLNQGNRTAGGQDRAQAGDETGRPATGETKGRAAGRIKTETRAQRPQVVAVDIQRFQVTYDPVDNVLKAAFRLINVSRPKTGISGRSVVVFKATGSPPIKWLSAPRVKLIDGAPSGKRGKLFRINNFKTMTFVARAVTLPIPYDTAAVYVFDRQGKLLEHQEFEFSLPQKAMLPAPAAKSRPGAKSDQGKERKAASKKAGHGPPKRAAKESAGAGVQNGSAAKMQSGPGRKGKADAGQSTGGVRQEQPQADQPADRGAGENNYYLFLGSDWNKKDHQAPAKESQAAEAVEKSPADQDDAAPPTAKQTESSQ